MKKREKQGKSKETRKQKLAIVQTLTHSTHSSTTTPIPNKTQSTSRPQNTQHHNTYTINGCDMPSQRHTHTHTHILSHFLFTYPSTHLPIPPQKRGFFYWRPLPPWHHHHHSRPKNATHPKKSALHTRKGHIEECFLCGKYPDPHPHRYKYVCPSIHTNMNIHNQTRIHTHACIYT